MSKLSMISWLRSLFRDKAVLPGANLVLGTLLVGVIAWVSAFLGGGWPIFWGIIGLGLVLSLIDLANLTSRKDLACRREVGASQERGREFAVELVFVNRGRIPLHLDLIDELPQVFVRPPIDHPNGWSIARRLVCPVGESCFVYRTQAAIRGDYALNRLYVRYRSGLGLWVKQTSFPIRSRVKVTPDLSGVRGSLARAQKLLMHQGGVVKRNVYGDSEFSQVRAYVVGDDPRRINWRQTAKMNELMSNVYQPEHGKYISILVDCGRVMGVELTDVNRLERALEAALSVAALALRQGDYVSMTVFSNTIRAHIPSGNSLGHLRTILDGVYGIQNDTQESNYGHVLSYLESVQKRQSMVLMFSDLTPFLLQDDLLSYVQGMRRRHLFMLLGVQDPMELCWSAAVPDTVQGSMLKSAAQKIRLEKKDRIRHWSSLGLHMAEVKEEHLAGAAVDSYVQAINRGML
ncbi:MAG: DUF58 domain-containing protein [Peptococcaceae bacterium]|nr:DUF58 domain-containing protein [Peptococcaceae bacterium]